MKALLWPLSLLYGAVAAVRNRLYDLGVFKIHKVEVPVISVGNITAGGTGKTPLIDYLLDLCREMRIRTAVVSRGYRGSCKTSHRVELQDFAAAVGKFGDEPCMLAWKHPEAAVFTGVDRVAVCQKAVADFRPQLILADDAFQHRRLHRDLDIVVLDSTAKPTQYRCLPWGRGREGFRNIRRAQLLVFSKANLAPPPMLRNLQVRIKSLGWDERRLLQADYRSEELVDFQSQRRIWRDLHGKRCLIVCGVGNPRSFEDLIRRHSSAEIVDRIFYPDHFSYTPKAIENIIERKKRCGADLVLCTVKDGVKLLPWRDRLQDLLMVELSVELGPESARQREKLCALVDEVVKKNRILDPA